MSAWRATFAGSTPGTGVFLAPSEPEAWLQADRQVGEGSYVLSISPID